MSYGPAFDKAVQAIYQLGAAAETAKTEAAQNDDEDALRCAGEMLRLVVRMIDSVLHLGEVVRRPESPLPGGDR